MDKAKEIYNFIEKIEYGWFDKDNKFHERLEKENYFNEFRLQSPSELRKSMRGVCWEQCELEREMFNEKDIKNNCYFVLYNDGVKFPCHTFLSFELNDRHYWFEHAWDKNKGIHEFETKEEMFKRVFEVFPKIINIKDIDYSKLYIFQYDKPKSHIGCLEFYKFASKGKPINFSYQPQ